MCDPSYGSKSASGGNNKEKRETSRVDKNSWWINIDKERKKEVTISPPVVSNVMHCLPPGCHNASKPKLQRNNHENLRMNF